MTHDHDDAGEDALAGIDLHVWRIPPPVAVHRPSLVVRALSPAAAPKKRARVAWILAGIVLLNAAIATIIVIVLARPGARQPTVTVQPAGGGSVDAQVRDLLQRLEQEQRELERKLAEIQELRALVTELSEKVRQYEQQDGRREHTVPKQRDRQAPDRIDHQQPIDPYEGAPPPSDLASCDEVSCVLTNFDGACCTKFRSGRPITNKISPTNALPDSLDRQSISNGIASVKARVAACARESAKGKVKVHVRVGAAGGVESVSVEMTPDAALGACVAAAVQRAVFPRTQAGGSFSYPFIF